MQERMMRRGVWIATGLAGLLAGALLADTVPAEAQQVRVDAGRAVAQRWCVNCHVIGPSQAQGSDQTASLRAIANKRGTTSGSLHAFLAVPHGKMPDQALSNADLDAVVAYILSLKR
jgi:mono/diheme cytochrome c family protein